MDLKFFLFVFTYSLISWGEPSLGPYSLKGKPTLVDFWASWCGPCKKSFPELEALRVKYKEQVQFIAVNFDRDPQDREKFLEKNPLGFLHLTDEQRVFKKQYNVVALPTTLVFDSHGKEILRLRGYKPEFKEKILTALQGALDQSK